MSAKHDRIIATRVLAMPTKKDTGERFRERLSKRRTHKRQWARPEDAKLVLSMHFSAHSPRLGVHYAEMSVEIPVAGGADYYTVVRTGKTREQALTAVIQEYQNSEWFHVFKSNGVYFYVTGQGMERLYRGYL